MVVTPNGEEFFPEGAVIPSELIESGTAELVSGRMECTENGPQFVPGKVMEIHGIRTFIPGKMIKGKQKLNFTKKIIRRNLKFDFTKKERNLISRKKKLMFLFFTKMKLLVKMFLYPEK